ncbi:hypothetical protein NMY22_g492 [Coprinellus aureogranulatus]|nr:hypothetical protein NMY22_g492 [Coprinellus aureogranulatus]
MASASLLSPSFDEDEDEYQPGLPELDDNPPTNVDVEGMELTTYSLKDMIHTASQIYAAELYARFVLFVLCGVAHDHAAILDINRDQEEMDLESLPNVQVTRDYDSVIGVCDSIMVRDTDLVYTMTSKFADDLQNNVHIFHDWDDELVRTVNDPHDIMQALKSTKGEPFSAIAHHPEYGFCNFWSAKQDQQRSDIWELGIRPAMADLLEARSSELPTKLKSELFRARAPDGRLLFTTKVFPHWLIEDLSRLIPYYLMQNGRRWAQGMVYVHIIRGVKNSSYHNFDDPTSHSRALEELFTLNSLSLTSVRAPGGGKWYVDVGVEISLPGKSLSWRTAAHATLYQQVARVDSSTAKRITSLGSSDYVRDHYSHLVQASGCRISPGRRGMGPHQVAYFQAYMTDKSLTAAKGNGHHAKHITAIQAIRRPNVTSSFLDHLIELYREAMHENHSSARVEVRVPLDQALRVLWPVDHDVLFQSIIVLDCGDLWAWRIHRALALQYLLEWQRKDSRLISRNTGALLLTATVPWLVNSLHATIDTRSASRELMKAVLPHGAVSEVMQDSLPFSMSLEPIMDEDEDERTVPKIDRGAFFLRYILVGSKHRVPRFPGTRFISDKACVTLFGDTLRGIVADFTAKQTGYAIHPDRIPNKIRQPPALPAPEGPTDFTIPFPRLESLTIKQCSPSTDEEIDLDDNDDLNADTIFQDLHLEKILQRLLRQFFVDLLNVSPNARRSNEGCTLRLTKEQRLKADGELYLNQNLADIWYACRWKRAEHSDWESVFNHLFPQKLKWVQGRGDNEETGGHFSKPKNVQNYPQTRYYSAWEELAERCGDTAFDALRRSLWREVFQHLYWLPAAVGHRIWDTKPRSGFQEFARQKDNVPFVNIFINSKEPPRWDVDSSVPHGMAPLGLESMDR